MIVNDAPQNEAILSNVGEIGEFRIRNSAKAFSILSSGLYANKIKAIIRELSTNARDSHKDAGKADVPFDVHLPTALEPWFSIRDYGTGLDHEQVVNIYTTYFESTKTNSNDFVGCLGLGSKSPFAVTENFTVTAIKNGVKGIYTAFINEHGVPSIARMAEEESNEPAGVEVRYAVEDRYDFDKYRSEATSVYRWFEIKPVVTGGQIDLTPMKYADTDIIPGVHTIADTRQSYAVMGGIAYPIDVPNEGSNLGSLASMLRCGLVMHFNIGELDFQASREGLSYIPQTIAAIKDKLTVLRAALADRLAEEADKIENIWERTHYLMERVDQNLWKSAVEKYVTDKQIPTITIAPGTYHHLRMKPFTFYETDLATQYNIVIKCFSKYSGNPGVTNHKPETEYDRSQAGAHLTKSKWNIQPQLNVVFVKNNTKIGASERARYHWRHKKEKSAHRNEVVYVLDYADRSKPALFDAFLAKILTPPNVMLADDLLKKEKAASSAKGLAVSILKLVPKYDTTGWYRRYSEEYVWRDAGKAADYQNHTVYYLPLSGYALETTYGQCDPKSIRSWIENCGIKSLQSLTVYGVRKSDIDNIKKLKNWINLEDHIKATLSTAATAPIMGMALNSIDNDFLKKYNVDILENVEDSSPYKQFMLNLKDVSAVDFNERNLKTLSDRYVPGLVTSIQAQVADVINKSKVLCNRYPLLRSLNEYRIDPKHVAEYINLIDAKDI